MLCITKISYLTYLSAMIVLSVLLITFACLKTAAYNLKLFGSSTYNDLRQTMLHDQNAGLSFSSEWQVLGPFQSGTRESVWGADPLELYGGFRNLSYDPETIFTSSLAADGFVKWGMSRMNASEPSPYHAEVVLQVNFSKIDWSLLQSVYGWPALQYQAWARGFLNVNGQDNQTVALFTKGLLEAWVDAEPYFGGDYYQYGRTPVILRLAPGRHVIDLRLVRDVRALGAVGEPIMEIAVGAEVRNELLYLDQGSLLVSESTNGKLGSPLASINVQSDITEWIEVVSINTPDVPQHNLVMEKTLRLAPYQTRPLIFNILLGPSAVMNFSVTVSYKIPGESKTLLTSRPFHIKLTERSWTETHKVTFYHPAKIVSYAILRPPPSSSTCTASSGQNSLPIILCLHGAGLEADGTLVRQMLDALYGTCAWILFPNGVTSWGGDDWHTWGAADVTAAVAAIASWIQSVNWNGPRVSPQDWIVTGHSNGGQGTWFLSTHYPDNLLAAAPVSGYSSIENYVPYTMWQSSEPSLSSILQKARSNYKHELLLDNLAGIPIMQQHGSDDDNVPAYHSRLMHKLLGQTGWPSEYHELLGTGHWFEGIMTTPSLLRFFNQTTIPSPPLDVLSEFTITIPSSGYIKSKCGIVVDQLQSPDVNGRISVAINVENGFWHLRTENIYRFHLLKDACRTRLPATITVDNTEASFKVDPAMCEMTWYVKDISTGKWSVSREAGWRNIDQRYGRQLGAMDAVLNTVGTFSIKMCSFGVERIALQTSRNLLQYFAADSQITRDCDPGKPQPGIGNVVTLAIGNDIPISNYTGFPIHSNRNRLVLLRRTIYSPSNDAAGTAILPGRGPCSKHEFAHEVGLGALFLRPLQDESLELVAWGADISGLEQAARLVPTLTGVGQPDFMVMSNSCRWRGHSGLYAAGFFDRSWQISSSSYIRGDARSCDIPSR